RSQCGVSKLDGVVYAVGGCDSWNCLNSAELYDPEAAVWKRITPMNHPRRGAGVVEYQGRLFAVGGSDGTHSLDSVDIYDPETQAWSLGARLNMPRANVGVAVVNDKLYAVGGFTGKWRHLLIGERTGCSALGFGNSSCGHWFSLIEVSGGFLRRSGGGRPGGSPAARTCRCCVGSGDLYGELWIAAGLRKVIRV
ncbi:PREDICTED: influenza virus NS1A-binding protein homolog A-like, partial [Priapulus caudatus]|uniref:Influenza virus NS1A-binding protein homolog A-like n=1 Tax=Priapulus caudatus TaxID=37621 RepID=A0ABM1F6J7_PRICU